MFQGKGLRLVTHAGEEYLLVFKDQEKAEKVHKKIREMDDGLEGRSNEIMDVKRH
jgi:hypothetical protein